MTGTVNIARVVIDVRTKALDRTFDYVVPTELATPVKPGHRVLVSFGNVRTLGYVMSVIATRMKGDAEEERKLKPILKVMDEEPMLTEELLRLVDWLCFRYVCTRLEAIESILPGVFRQEKETEASSVVVLHAEQSPEDLERAAFSKQKRAPKQAGLLRQLARDGVMSLPDNGVVPSDPAVKALVASGHASLKRLEHIPEIAASLSSENEEGERTLTPYQERVLREVSKALDNGREAFFVLHGVTGSGKTEVYLRAIAQCLSQGKSAIVLVPEISLTPQMVGRFTARFGRRVAVLHSRLGAREKKDEWIRLRRGDARIAVGARSAVFAPLVDLGLIIVDEEHETSYKQEETVRYDAREVAKWRAKSGWGVVLSGSATPSLTAMHEVAQGEARLLTLPTRVNNSPLPPVEIVDMREELRAGNHQLFSRALASGVEAALSEGMQSILFLNRRGYASFLLCRSCGEVVLCPHCDISLTLHRAGEDPHLRCHYCQHRSPVPQRCPNCGEDALRSFGVGTQQVEQEIERSWPQARVLRMDVDTTRKKGAHQQLLQAFADGEADILVGTQMVAKGLDFPKVTFVGVVAADTMLAIPDYRSAERTFNLLTQVAGRAGRAYLPGKTVVQTFRPEHYAVKSAARHDYSSFYREEILYRSRFEYPPYCELALFVAVHEEERLAQGAAARFEREVLRRAAAATITVLAAAPSGVKRAEDQFRYQVVLKYSSWEAVHDAVVGAYGLVYDRLRRLKGYAVLDVNAGRI